LKTSGKSFWRRLFGEQGFFVSGDYFQAHICSSGSEGLSAKDGTASLGTKKFMVVL
jgi:hypothetical protein